MTILSEKLELEIESRKFTSTAGAIKKMGISLILYKKILAGKLDHTKRTINFLKRFCSTIEDCDFVNIYTSHTNAETGSAPSEAKLKEMANKPIVRSTASSVDEYTGHTTGHSNVVM